MKTVVVVGGGLTGCLTALKLSEKGCEVHLVEDQISVLKTFSSIKIDGVELNPGFYAVEIPRAKDVSLYFDECLNFSGIVFPQRRYLFLKDDLIDENLDINEWPSWIADSLPKEKISLNSINEVEKVLDKKYLEFLKETSWRFNPWSEQKSNAIPWFLPKNINIYSNDEGSIFRYKVRNQLINEFLYTPKDGLFSELILGMTKLLEQKSIKLHLSTKVFLDSQNSVDKQLVKLGIKKESDIIPKIIFTAPSTSLLNLSERALIEEAFSTRFTRIIALVEVDNCVLDSDMTQLLVLNNKAPDLARISFVAPQLKTKDSQKKLLLCEFLKKGSWEEDQDDLFNQSQIIISKFARIKRWRGSKNLGLGFRPISSWYKRAENSVNKYVAENIPFLEIKPYFGPMNMAKASILSDQFCQNI